MDNSTIDLYLHAGEIVIFLLGMSLPAWVNTIQMRRILRDFPPHRHYDDDGVLYPKGYEPPKPQHLSHRSKPGS